MSGLAVIERYNPLRVIRWPARNIRWKINGALGPFLVVTYIP
jgi:hypothetical protein